MDLLHPSGVQLELGASQLDGMEWGKLTGRSQGSWEVPVASSGLAMNSYMSIESNNNKFKHSIVINNDAVLGLGIQAEILELAQACEFSEPDLFGIRLAVEEAIVNAIKHGNQSDPAKRVRIDYEVDHEQVRVRIEDEGDGFDPAQVPDPTQPEFLERPCGRGLLLMRHYMSEVHFNDRGNSVEMVKRKGDQRTADDE